jgi:hypothetical protein
MLLLFGPWSSTPAPPAPTGPGMADFLALELGDPIALSESMTGLVNQHYWVQALTYSFREGNILTVTVSLVPSVIESPVFVVGDPDLGIVGDAVLGY